MPELNENFYLSYICVFLVSWLCIECMFIVWVTNILSLSFCKLELKEKERGIIAASMVPDYINEKEIFCQNLGDLKCNFI